ncbi:hypothetical protein EIP86_006628 [Pleurotus ostreatoroseus]|nr:hypothetical protein EIP86_006628 [Pleurotus ostreatoroseus]
MNEKQSFIIEDLDDHHVVIKADEEWRVRKELEAEVSHIFSFFDCFAHSCFRYGLSQIENQGLVFKIFYD